MSSNSLLTFTFWHKNRILYHVKISQHNWQGVLLCNSWIMTSLQACIDYRCKCQVRSMGAAFITFPTWKGCVFRHLVHKKESSSVWRTAVEKRYNVQTCLWKCDIRISSLVFDFFGTWHLRGCYWFVSEFYKLKSHQNMCKHLKRLESGQSLSNTHGLWLWQITRISYLLWDVCQYSRHQRSHKTSICPNASSSKFGKQKNLGQSRSENKKGLKR